MRLWSLPSLLAAAGLSAALVAPFHANWTSGDKPFILEARLASSAAGHVQVYYDRGEGFQEPASATEDLAQATEPKVYRLPIPPGRYRRLRFDPIDRDGTVTIASARLLDADGHSVRDIPLTQIQPLQDIQSLAVDRGALRVVVAPGTNDPQLLLPLDSPLVLRPSRPWGRTFRPCIVPFFAVGMGLALALFGLDRSPGARRRGREAGSWLLGHPRGSLALIAAAAVVASCYPVVFLGRSFVSPDTGTFLLYDGMPTLPGYAFHTLADPKGSDVGAAMWQQVPTAAIESRALFRDHEIPVWNRYNSAGTPLIGQGQSMIGDPLHWLVIAAQSAAWAWDLKYLAAKWLLALGLGLCVWTLCRQAPAAWIIATAAPFFGFFLYRIDHPAFFSFCYAPWPLYCWLRLTEAGSGRAAIRGSIALILANAALLNSGTVKEAAGLLLIMNLAGAAVLLTAPMSGKRRLACAAAIGGGAAVFAALTAPAWHPFADALRAAYTSSNAPAAFQIQPGLLLGAFDEAFFRPLTPQDLVFNPAANFLILGGVLYFLATLRLHFADRRSMALAAVALVPLALAFGFIPPGWIVRWPLIGHVAHLDNSFGCGLILLWAVIAGIGFATAARRLGTAGGRADLGVAALLLFALIFAYVGFGQAAHRSEQGGAETFSVWAQGESLPVRPLLWLYLAALVAALAGLGLTARRALARGRFTAASVFIAILCAYILIWRQAQEPAAAGASDYTFQPGARVNFSARSAAIGRVRQAVAAAPARAIGLQENFFPGWGAMVGVEGISGPDALMDPRYRELLSLSPLERRWDWRAYLSRDILGAARPFLDFLNVRYYFDLRSDQGALGAVLRLVQTGDLDVYESPTAWPRAFFTDRLARYDQPAELADQIRRGDGRPFAAIQSPDLVAAPEVGRLSANVRTRAVVPASAYRLTEDSTAFTVEAPGPGLAVLNETGWAGYGAAQVDGQPTPVIRVNHAFAGVFLATAGSHRIVVTYRPRRWPLLLGLSGGAALALAAAGLGTLSRPRRPVVSFAPAS
jgi:hypothetical protein